VEKIIIINESSQVSTSFQKEKVEDLLYEFLRDRTPLTEIVKRQLKVLINDWSAGVKSESM